MAMLLLKRRALFSKSAGSHCANCHYVPGCCCQLSAFLWLMS